MAKCSCGADLRATKKEHEVTVHLTNPGPVKFKAEGIKCGNCNTHVFSEDNAGKVFDSFDKARKEQHH